MKIASCESQTLYQIYLDLKKVYDSIDRDRVVDIIKQYNIGPNIHRYILIVWKQQWFMLRRAGFYSDTIEVERGCKQGDIDSPIILN